MYGADYKEEEDPRKYVSQKTSRGPLGDNWINEYWEMCKVIMLFMMDEDMASWGLFLSVLL